MTMRLIWFVLAGFLLGFTASTLWEWLYYRRQRLALDVRRFEELEGRLAEEKAVNTQLRMMLSGTQQELESSLPDAESSEAQQQMAPVAYSSPGVFLDSETSEPELNRDESPPYDTQEVDPAAVDLLIASAAATLKAVDDNRPDDIDFGRLAAELERESASGSGQQSSEMDVPYVPRTDDYPDDLSNIVGIGNVYKYRLYAAGVFTWRQVAECDVEMLRETTSAYTGAVVGEWPQQARRLAEKQDREDAIYSGPTPDDLAHIKGVTPADEEVLYKGGICTYGQLACQTLAELQDMFPNTDENEPEFMQWIQSAIAIGAVRRDASTKP